MMPSLSPSRSRKPGSIGAMTSTIALPMVSTSNCVSAIGWRTPGRNRGGDSGDCPLAQRRPIPVLGGWRLGFEPAPFGDDATIAFGLARLADITAVKDQPVMRVEQIFLRH